MEVPQSVEGNPAAAAVPRSNRRIAIRRGWPFPLRRPRCSVREWSAGFEGIERCRRPAADAGGRRVEAGGANVARIRRIGSALCNSPVASGRRR